MVAALLAGFDLPQLYPGIVSSGAEHGLKFLRCGEVGAGTGGQIPAPGQQLHGR